MKCLIFAFFVSRIYSDAVCDQDTFINELKQDLADNNMLDCLRVIVPPHMGQETAEQKNRRLAAQWDSDCSFDGPESWVREMSKVFNIASLVNNVGDVVERDSDNEADLCEFVRAAFNANKFPKMGSITNMNKDFLQKVACAGHKSQTQPCAVNNESFFASKSWFILFQGMTITYDGAPDWRLYKKPEPKAEEEVLDTADEEDESEMSPEQKRKLLEAENMSGRFNNPTQYDKTKVYKLTINSDKFEDVGEMFSFDKAQKDANVLLWGMLNNQFEPSNQGEKRWCAMRFLVNADPAAAVKTDLSTKEFYHPHFSLFNVNITKIDTNIKASLQLTCDKSVTMLGNEKSYTDVFFNMLALSNKFPFHAATSSPENFPKDPNPPGSVSPGWKNIGLELDVNKQKGKNYSYKDQVTDHQPVMIIYQVRFKMMGTMKLRVLQEEVGGLPEKTFEIANSY